MTLKERKISPGPISHCVLAIDTDFPSLREKKIEGMTA